jgi:hypothetical protein
MTSFASKPVVLPSALSRYAAFVYWSMTIPSTSPSSAGCLRSYEPTAVRRALVGFFRFQTSLDWTRGYHIGEGKARNGGGREGGGEGGSA